MKPIIQKIGLLVAMLSTILSASAYDFRDGDLEYTIISEQDRTVEVVSPDYSGSSIVIPANVTYKSKTYKVISIGDYAFQYCRRLTSVTIPNSVTSIGEYAFEGCHSMTSIGVDSENLNYSSLDGVLFDKGKKVLVSYPKGKEGAYAIPNSVTSIGESAFQYCQRLTSVTIPNSVTTIGKSAFTGCGALTSVTIPNSVTTIGDYAFCYCWRLTSVTIGNSVTTIGEYAFERCDALTSVTIPNSVTSIGNRAFYWCDNLTSVVIGNSVTAIGEQAFSFCKNLTAIQVDNSNINFSSLDGVLFDKEKELLIACPGGKERAYTIPNSVTTIGDNAFALARLTSVTIPNSVTSIGNNAFIECDGLRSITIPNSVTTIGKSAFEWCEWLASVTIGSSVKSIGDRAFQYCDLTKVYCSALTPPIAGSIFHEKALSLLGCLYVPVGTKGAYEAVDPWRNFWNIEEFDFSGVDDIQIPECDIDVSCIGGQIIVTNAPDGLTARVFNLQGALIRETREHIIDGLAEGVYIVSIGGKSFKVAL